MFRVAHILDGHQSFRNSMHLNVRYGLEILTVFVVICAFYIR